MNGKRNLSAPLLCLLALAASAAPVVEGQQEASWTGSPQQAFLDGPIVQTYQCGTCHTITDQGGSVGPILNMVGLRRTADWLDAWLQDPNSVKPGTKMPKFPLSEEERRLAVQMLSEMKRPLNTAEILAAEVPLVDKGQALFRDYDCHACHRIGDEGRFVGPDLTWVGIRKPEEWERIWLSDPPGFKPDTFMPDFHIPADGVEALAAYLHTLQGQDNPAGRQWEFMISFMINTSAKDRGEMVFKRLGCWACHGENGKGGIHNPNSAAGHETVPNLKGTRDAYDIEAFLEKITRGTAIPAAQPDAIPQPYDCPAYPPEALNEQGLADLYAYVSSLAPPKSRWTVK